MWRSFPSDGFLKLFHGGEDSFATGSVEEFESFDFVSASVSLDVDCSIGFDSSDRSVEYAGFIVKANAEKPQMIKMDLDIYSTLFMCFCTIGSS